MIHTSISLTLRRRKEFDSYSEIRKLNFPQYLNILNHSIENERKVVHFASKYIIQIIMGELVKLDFNWIGEVSNNLIDKVYNSTGLCFKGKSSKQIAQEELIEYLKKSNLPELEKCALISSAKKIIKEYANKMDVVEKAIDYLSESAKPSEMNEYWLNVFFDKVGLVSDEEFKLIWARLLAEECNENESVPRSLLYTLEQMNNNDAKNFMKLASFVVLVNDKPVPYFLNSYRDYYDKKGIKNKI
ncbi:MAG: DUF2806 domain-containing protein [Lachnospiraceae bacterium]|nr:DUF2806 domain-containing protein [Lachnospiraceae bacterium]